MAVIKPNSVVIVTGSHRSGTSVTTYILQSLGINLGNNLLKGPEFSNPDGHFEDIDIMELHDKVLLENHMMWHNIMKCFTIDRFNDIMKSLNRLNYWNLLYEHKIKKFSDVNTCFGYKDPRLSIMLDVVCTKLRQDGYNPVVVLCWRNCYDIALSLIKRDHFTLPKAMNVAVSYQFMLGNTMVPFLERDRIPFVNIDFEKLVRRPKQSVTKLSSFLKTELGIHISPLSIEKALRCVRVRAA